MPAARAAASREPPSSTRASASMRHAARASRHRPAARRSSTAPSSFRVIPTVMAPPPIGYTADQPRQAPRGSEHHDASAIRAVGITAHLRKRRLISSSCEASGEELDGGEMDHGGGRGEGCLEVLGQPSVAAEPSEGPLNGLITNDKFCLTRTGRLRLSWPRARVGLRVPASLQPPGGVTHQGGEHAAAATHLARPAQRRAGGNRPAALGSGLPASPAVGGHGPACVGRGAGAPDPAGDIPCA
jgi:hypothetical protein